VGSSGSSTRPGRCLPLRGLYQASPALAPIRHVDRLLWDVASVGGPDGRPDAALARAAAWSAAGIGLRIALGRPGGQFATGSVSLGDGASLDEGPGNRLRLLRRGRGAGLADLNPRWRPD